MNSPGFIKAACLLGIFSLTSLISAQSLDHGLILIEGGEFIMGSPEGEAWRESDETVHRVRLDSFYMGKYEVSQEEYSRITGKNPSRFKDGDLPVENVSWYDAVEYCNLLSRTEGLRPAYSIKVNSVIWNRESDGYRLPTEAEWEYACRGGRSTPFYTGRNITVNQANYYGSYPYTIEDHYFSRDGLEVSPGVYREKTLPVDHFDPNPLGLFNMHGNVSEWCFDLYGPYSSGVPDNPAGADDGNLRVCRGGGWNDFGKHLRSAYRSALPPGDTFPSRGFRIVRNGK